MDRARLERDLARVLTQLATRLTRVPATDLTIILERALREAVRVSRGADENGQGPRWTALFNRLLAGAGDGLAAALQRHPEVRRSDTRAAACVVVHGLEGAVRRSAELPGAHARSQARLATAHMLKIFLTEAV
jgi:hypothetical protein